MDDLLTVEMCEAYFRSRLNEPVGTESSCPLREVLAANGIKALVAFTAWHKKGESGWHVINPALKKFVQLVDVEKIPPRGSGLRGTGWSRITGQIALDLLAQAKEATAWAPLLD